MCRNHSPRKAKLVISGMPRPMAATRSRLDSGAADVWTRSWVSVGILARVLADRDGDPRIPQGTDLFILGEVGTADAHTCGMEDLGGRRHADAADAHEMDGGEVRRKMHGRKAIGRSEG